MEIYIIRHAQSENNALMEDQHLRVQDPSLTPTGFKQADCLSDFLVDATNLEELVRHKVDAPERETPFRHTFTHLYCSPMLRALQTTQPVAAKLGMTPEVWIDIHEHGGIFLEKDGVATGFGGMTRSQILADFPDYVLPEAITEDGWWNPLNGMEHISQLYARATRVAGRLRARAQSPETKDDKVALVVHGMFIDALIKAFTHNLPSDRYFHWHYNTAITRLDLIEDGVVILRYANRVTHLPAELVT